MPDAAAAPEENPSDQVSANWKYATIGLIGLAAFQFWWWNKKAPQVLKLGEAKSGGGY